MRLISFGAIGAPAFAQLSPSADWAVHGANQYQMTPNVTYRTASNTELKMDVYARRGVTTPQPTLIYMHGGFWVAGNKEGAIFAILPWLEMGWNVLLRAEVCGLTRADVQHRHEPHCRDESAGGHLALSLGMIPESEGLAKTVRAHNPK